MPDGDVLTLSLSLMGRPVRSYTFGKPVITVGRDPACDIVVENPGVSRNHLYFTKTSDDEYEVVDGESANGTFLNDYPVKCKILVQNGDCVRFGKYTLAVKYEHDRRVSRPDHAKAVDADPRTMILSRSELQHLMEMQRKAEQSAPAETSAPVLSPILTPEPAPSPAVPLSSDEPVKPRSDRTGLVTTIVGLVLGAVIGGIFLWFALR